MHHRAQLACPCHQEKKQAPINSVHAWHCSYSLRTLYQMLQFHAMLQYSTGSVSKFNKEVPWPSMPARAPWISNGSASLVRFGLIFVIRVDGFKLYVVLGWSWRSWGRFCSFYAQGISSWERSVRGTEHTRLLILLRFLILSLQTWKRTTKQLFTDVDNISRTEGVCSNVFPGMYELNFVLVWTNCIRGVVFSVMSGSSSNGSK
jgi:hypothetical protein